MHVIWKRPDGFHGADPADFMVVELSGRSKLWLHKKDTSWFPFRIAGGWQEQESTQRLNLLVNLLHKDEKFWVDALLKIFDDTMGDDPSKFVEDIQKWLVDLKGHLKGDTWELEIMNQALSEVEHRVGNVKQRFIDATK
jgi:hypothetical protein